MVQSFKAKTIAVAIVVDDLAAKTGKVHRLETDGYGTALLNS